MCEKCIDHYFGDNCTVYCRPENGYYNCSERGNKICLDDTKTAESNCETPKHKYDETSSQVNIPLIGGAGGVGLLFIMLAAVILFKVRKRKDTDEKEDEESLEYSSNGPLYNNKEINIKFSVNRQPTPTSEGPREGKENRQAPIQPDKKQDAVLSRIQFQYPSSTPGTSFIYYNRAE